MRKYVDRPHAITYTGITYAEQYAAGEPLDEILAIARRAHSDAAVAEVPELNVALVRYLRVPDDRPARLAYVVVPDGHYLAYSQTFDLLYESSPETFAREHDPVPPV